MKRVLISCMAALLMMPCFAKTPAQKLIKRLQQLEQRGYMFGHQDDPFYGTTWSRIGNMPDSMSAQTNVCSDTYLVTGDFPAVMGFDLGGIEKGDSRNLDSVPFTMIREEIRKHHERGGVITISWHPRNPLTGGNAWDVKNNQTVRSILPNGEKHALFSEWMKRVADFLLTLNDSKGRPIPFILRPWHEYNGSWFWWGEKNCTAEDFRSLWNMFQDYVNSRGLKKNIVWSCSPNLQGNHTLSHFMERWPGDDRVDIVGEDAYQWGTVEDFVKQTTSDLDFLSDYAKKHKKLLAMTECGRQNSPYATWWTEILKPIIDKYSISYILCWRNYYKEHFGPAPDLCTKDDFIRFYNADNTLFLNDIK